MPFSQFSWTSFQYCSRDRSRNVFPNLIITKKTEAHAMPIKAAEMKQFWYPMLSIQGVILNEVSVCLLLELEENLPISNCKRHGIPNQNHTRHGDTTQLSVAVNKVIDTKRDATGAREGQNAHSNNESKPMDLMSSTHTPKDKGTRHKYHTSEEGPETVLCLHDAIVPAGEFDSEPVAESASEEGSVSVSIGCSIRPSWRSYARITPMIGAT